MDLGIRDKAGNVVPWFTFPALEYLYQLDLSDKSVFEFGSGCSTVYWDKNCKSVICVDDNPVFEGLKEHLSEKTKFILKTDDYSSCILLEEQNFDIIVVDGAYRYRCAEAALSKLNSGGMIILDNSDWCRKTVELLSKEEDLLQIDFHGNGNINPYTWTTSFFFKRDFNIKYKELRPNWSSSPWQREFKGELGPDLP